MSQITSTFLTTRQLARLWLVSEATVKRWADAGHLRFTRTVGGHRRFALEEVVRFQRERGLDRAPGAAAALEPSAREAAAVSEIQERVFAGEQVAEQFFDAAAAGREGFATAILLEAFLSGTAPARMFDEVVAVALRRVGDLWHRGDLTVADEHLATRTAIRAVEALRTAAISRRAGAPRAICCAVEDELHDVAALCVQVMLEIEGWEVKNLGAHTPLFALTDAVEKHAPALVCVSATVHTSLARNERDYPRLSEAVRARGARIVLGGEGFRDPATRRRFPADLHAESCKDLSELLAREFS